MPLNSEDKIKYKTLYLQTAREYVKSLQDNIVQLQEGKGDTEIIDILHRDSHSLKGQSLMMEYNAMSELSLLLENIFSAKKEQKIVLSKELLAKIAEAVKEMEACLDEIDKNNKEKDLSQAVEELKGLTTTI